MRYALIGLLLSGCAVATSPPPMPAVEVLSRDGGPTGATYYQPKWDACKEVGPALSQPFLDCMAAQGLTVKPVAASPGHTPRDATADFSLLMGGLIRGWR